MGGPVEMTETTVWPLRLPDTFCFKSNAHELIGLEGTGLFLPEAVGMVPEMLHTACYRGFICTYKIKCEELRGRSLGDVCRRSRNNVPKAVTKSVPPSRG